MRRFVQAELCSCTIGIVVHADSVASADLRPEWEERSQWCVQEEGDNKDRASDTDRRRPEVVSETDRGRYREKEKERQIEIQRERGKERKQERERERKTAKMRERERNNK